MESPKSHPSHFCFTLQFPSAYYHPPQFTKVTCTRVRVPFTAFQDPCWGPDLSSQQPSHLGPG